VLAKTSDAPVPDLNCLEGFATDARRVEGLLDIGFALLRAFDCAPAASVTPLDRPRSIEERLRARGLTPVDRWQTMVFAGERAMIVPESVVEVRVAEPDDARTFAEVHAGSERWVRKLSLPATLEGMHDGTGTFYLGYVDGEPAGTLHLLRDGGTAGIYAVGTRRSFRRRGVATALMRRAIADARAAGCDVIALRTLSGGDAERLYAAMGFAPAFQSALWVMQPRP
jgi:GNAT superfamily N-acetyltransferase